MNILMSSRQTGGDRGLLEFVSSVQSMWHLCTEFLDLIHWVKIIGDRILEASQSARPASNEFIQLVLIELNMSVGRQWLVKLKFLLFESEKDHFCLVLSLIVPSPYIAHIFWAVLEPTFFIERERSQKGFPCFLSVWSSNITHLKNFFKKK